MSKRRIETLVVKVNDNRWAIVQESKVKVKLTEAKNKFDEKVIKNLRQMEERFANV